MQIPDKLLKKWEALRSPEDTAKIAEKANTTTATIRNAWKDKYCSDSVFTAMASFYNQKAEFLKEFIS